MKAYQLALEYGGTGQIWDLLPVKAHYTLFLPASFTPSFPSPFLSSPLHLFHDLLDLLGFDFYLIAADESSGLQDERTERMKKSAFLKIAQMLPAHHV